MFVTLKKITSVKLETLANGRHYNMKYRSCFSVVSHCPKVGQSRVTERQKKTNRPISRRPEKQMLCSD